MDFGLVPGSLHIFKSPPSNYIKCIITQKVNTHTHMHAGQDGLQAVKAETHSACSTQRQVVHLLGERSHYTGGVKRQTGLHGRGWGDHSTLRQGGRTHDRPGYTHCCTR